MANKSRPKQVMFRLSEEEIEFLKSDIEDWESQIAEIKADFLKTNEKADWEKEVEKVNQWWEEKERFKGENGGVL